MILQTSRQTTQKNTGFWTLSGQLPAQQFPWIQKWMQTAADVLHFFWATGPGRGDLFLRYREKTIKHNAFEAHFSKTSIFVLLLTSSRPRAVPLLNVRGQPRTCFFLCGGSSPKAWDQWNSGLSPWLENCHTLLQRSAEPPKQKLSRNCNVPNTGLWLPPCLQQDKMESAIYIYILQVYKCVCLHMHLDK